MPGAKVRCICLGSLTNDIQSKNAGVNMICCDIFFDDAETFEQVRSSGFVIYGIHSASS